MKSVDLGDQQQPSRVEGVVAGALGDQVEPLAASGCHRLDRVALPGCAVCSHEVALSGVVVHLDRGWSDRVEVLAGAVGGQAVQRCGVVGQLAAASVGEVLAQLVAV